MLTTCGLKVTFLVSEGVRQTLPESMLLGLDESDVRL